MDPATEAAKDRRHVYLACRQCRNRKIKCDGAHPVCSTCIRRRSPQCDYDREPRRRGPDRHRRVRIHHDSGPPPSLTRPRRSQKRASNDVVAHPSQGIVRQDKTLPVSQYIYAISPRTSDRNPNAQLLQWFSFNASFPDVPSPSWDSSAHTK
ncbi:hypothetical protein BS47DRAFT_1083648 [Hydnum rufescens UP504]|uniref:Zn(2)-C6 fungal-type domain-containing protein n=1 Tax=Hydnum rufescens UP504 TaxID=1448309 RepID=A0A9P6B8Y6_9AGAM|nr:hypothetical protein BS47DRAFT_1083648 [Hydnum rufescens UP504]